MIKLKTDSLKRAVLLGFMFGLLLMGTAPVARTAALPAVTSPIAYVGADTCGGFPDKPIVTSINIGCTGKGNPIIDTTFAIIRFLSVGVGFAIVAGLIIAGIQFTASRGDPQLRAKALSRIYNVVIALFVFIFAYAILNYVIPVGFFNG